MESPAFKSADSGFTLIEVLMALAIFSIGLLAMGALQSAALMQTGDIGRKTEALSVLEDQAERLKELRFYIDVSSQTFSADLAAGNPVNRLNGRYTVHWDVVDDSPIDEVTVPDDLLLANVPAGTYTVSKTITVSVTEPGGDMYDDSIAMVEFVKTWAADGMQ